MKIAFSLSNTVKYVDTCKNIYGHSRTVTNYHSDTFYWYIGLQLVTEARTVLTSMFVNDDLQHLTILDA